MALTKIGKEGITGISNASDATAITITSGELVGIGTSAPASKLDLYTDTASGFNYPLFLSANNSNAAKRDYVQLGFSVQQGAAGSETGGFDLKALRNNTPVYLANYGGAAGAAKWQFYTEGTERMRIDTAGNVLVGTTSSVSSNIRMSIKGGDSVDIAEFIAATNDKKIIFRNASNSNVGNINIGSSATAFNTSSDYRLKENVDYDWDATTRLKQLKPARFNFIVDESNTLVDGFLAHEAQAIVPEAITGTKDAMTTEVLYVEGDELPEGVSVGDVKEASVPDYQGIDQSKLVPLLVKTIQELEARLTAGGL